jgi:predicted DNA-binding protein YlxM (UPF0122 family)
MAEAHVRIDEGIKRGKRIRPIASPRRKAIVPACNSKLANLDATAVIRRYLEDQTTAEIAKEIGVHRSGLHQWLLRNCEEHWREAQIARALSALEEHKDNLRVANDALSLARAREGLRAAQWELERLFGRLYGAKQEVTITDKTDLGERLRRARERVIDGESSVVDAEQHAAPQQIESNGG